jgi:hypothetical protein
MSPLLEMQNPACSRSLHEVPFGARRTVTETLKANMLNPTTIENIDLLRMRDRSITLADLNQLRLTGHEDAFPDLIRSL